MCEDNEATIKMMLKKRSQAMRHIGKTHRINLDFLFDPCEAEDINLRYARTHQIIAGIMTKRFSSSVTWDILIALLGLRPTPIGISLSVLPIQGDHKNTKGETLARGDP